MAKKGNPLDGKTQAEIDIIMSKRVKDMDKDEIRVYKRVKYNAWIKKNPERAPKNKKKENNSSKYKPIKFVQEAEEKKYNDNKKEKESGLGLLPKSKPVITNGKLPRWVKVENLNDKQKEWSENRKILVSVKGIIKICRLHWIKDDMPTIICNGMDPFFLSWPVAYCAIRYGFIQHYERDAILKETSIA